MANTNNEFLGRGTIQFELTLSSAATTCYSGHILPVGAIVTGVKTMIPGARTISGDATWCLSVGTTPVCATTNVSDLGAQTIPTAYALLTTAGMYIPVVGEVIAVANGSAQTAVVDIYVDYIFVP